MKKRYLLILPILVFSLFGCINSLGDNDDSSGFVVASGTLYVPNKTVSEPTSAVIEPVEMTVVTPLRSVRKRASASTIANRVSSTAISHTELDSASANEETLNQVQGDGSQVRNDVASRQAFPTATTEKLYYSISCVQNSKTYNGTVTSSSSSVSFTINVPVGSSIITAKAFLDKEKKQQVYEGSLSLTNVTTSTDLSSQTITLNDLQSGTEANATVSLPILINSDVTISKISAVVSTGSTTSGTSSTSATVELSSPTSGTTYYFAPTSSSDTAFSASAATSANTVPGDYNVTFSFYATDSSSNEYLVFQTTQKITASNYLATSTWKGVGSEPCINASGVMEITNALCKTFLSTTFYVDSTNGSDTSASGSFSSPFKSIQKAVQVVEALKTTSTSTYTIFLKGNVTGDDENYTTDSTNGNSLICINPSFSLNIIIKSYGTNLFNINAARTSTSSIKYRILYVGTNANVTLKNISLNNAYSESSGGAIYNAGSLILNSNVTIADNNTDKSGGGIFNKGSLTINGGTTISNNTATSAGGGVYNNAVGTTTINGTSEAVVTISSNNSTSGGGIYNKTSNNISLTNVKIINNTSTKSGGGLYNSAGKIILTDVTVDGNSATEYGGGLVNNDDGTFNLINTTFSNNNATKTGGAIYCKGTLIVSGGTVNNNESESNGAGFYLITDSSSEISNCNFQENKATDSGGAIYCNGTLNISNSTIKNNSATEYGGGFYFSNESSVEIKNCTLEENSSEKSGGAIFASGTFTFSGSTGATESSDNNDVYLNISTTNSYSPYITLSSDFTGTSGTTSARITLASYTEDYVVLSGDGVSETNCGYFKVTDEGYQIGSDGKLKKKTNTSTSTSISSISAYSDLKKGGTYSISTEDDLNQLATLCNSSSNYAPFEEMTILLENDIALTCSETNPFTTIGTSVYTFAGTFDGQGHKISNLYVNSTNQVGLFAALNGGTIKNLTVEGTVKGTSASSTKYGVGGIVGYALSTAVIENCVSNVTVSSDSITHVGGICGYATTSTIIRNCINIGNVTSSVEYTGGIVGFAETASSKTPAIYNCANFGTITGTEDVGGIAGTTEGDVSICYDVGTVSSSSSATTVAALANVTGTDSSYYANCRYLSGSASTGFVGSSSAMAGTFTASESDITNLKTDLNNFVTNKADSNLNSWDKTYSYNSLEYPVCVEVKVGTSFSGAKVNHTTYTVDGSTVIELNDSVTSFTSGTTYTIKDKTALEKLATLVNDGNSGVGATFALTNNIDLENSNPSIGSTLLCAFEGTFDGNNYCISNLTLPTGSNKGLFCYLGDYDGDESKKATVKNIRVKGTSVSTKTSGVISGNIYGKVDIINCISEIDFTSDSVERTFVGGIVGYINNSSGGTTVNIINCINNSSFKTTKSGSTYLAGFVGGVAGDVNLKIRNSLNNGSITANVNDLTTDESSYIAGFVNSEKSSSSSGNVEIKYCVNNGSITSTATTVSCIGAFTGDSYSTISYSEYSTDTEVISGTAITAKNSTEDSSATNLTSVFTFTSSTASTVADTMNTYNDNDSDYTYVNWKTNASGLPDLDLAIEDVN